jgi:hypothetical protein
MSSAVPGTVSYCEIVVTRYFVGDLKQCVPVNSSLARLLGVGEMRGAAQRKGPAITRGFSGVHMWDERFSESDKVEGQKHRSEAETLESMLLPFERLYRHGII